MSRHRFSRRTVLGAATFAAMTAFAGTQASAADIIRWGSSVLGAGSQTVIAAMASVVASNSDLKVVEQVTGGPAENMRLLQQGEVGIGQVTSGVA